MVYYSDITIGNLKNPDCQARKSLQLLGLRLDFMLRHKNWNTKLEQAPVARNLKRATPVVMTIVVLN